MGKVAYMPTILNRLIRFYTVRNNIFDSSQGDIIENRKRIDRLSSSLRPPRGVTIEEVSANGVHAEWNIPQDPAEGKALLYIHGGGWTICSTKTHRPLVGRLAKAGRVRVLSIDYRLAPEHPFPAALEDCLAAYKWLLDQGFHPANMMIAGDSAGGNLTLATLLALKSGEGPLPAAAIGLSPATDLAATGESYRTKADIDPILILPKEGQPPIHHPYSVGRDVRDPLISPLYGDLHGLPPILIHVGEEEILLDDSKMFVEKACAAGVEAKVVVWKNQFHVFQASAPFNPDAQKSINQMGEFIREKLKIA
jgi:epsilon-lactone hydrolase